MRIVIYGGFQQAMEMSFWVPLKSIIQDSSSRGWPWRLVLNPIEKRLGIPKQKNAKSSMFQYVPINPTNSPVETGDFSKKITGSSNESTSYYSSSKCPIRSRWETLCQVHQVQCPGDRPRSSAASDNPWLPDICNNLPKGKSHWIPWNLVRYHQILLNPIQSH
jgi:hypothetical protein